MNTDSGLPVKPELLLDAMAQFCDDVFLVSIWEDRYQIIRARGLEDDPGIESYSAMAAYCADHFAEPEQSASLYYLTSAEYICTHLSAENPRYHVDFRSVRGGAPGYFRIHVTLVDTDESGIAQHVLVAIQEITTRAKERDLNDVAFSQMCRDYAQIGFVDLNRDSITFAYVAPEEELDPAGTQRYGAFLESSLAASALPEYRDAVRSTLAAKQIRNMLDGGVPRVELDFRRQRSRVRVKVVPLNGYTPEDARVMWYLRDITGEEARANAYLDELLRNNAALNQALSAEKQYRLALMADSYFYYTFDVSGDGLIKEKFLAKDGSDIIRELTGIDGPVPFELLARRWREVYKPVFARETGEDVFTLSYLRRAFMRYERMIDMEVQQTLPEGSDKPEFFEVSIVLSEDELSGHIMACVIWKDISEARGRELQTRLALRDAYEVAEQASRAKSEFLSRMSHDIRTPMNAIIGMTAIAKARLDDPERVEDCLEKINVSSKHLLGLVNEVLDMSKIESGKVDLTEEPFDLSDLIDGLTQMVRPQIAAKHHQFDIHLNNVRHEKVIGDSLRIQQSFVNLMSNAIKYTPEHGQIDLIITELPCRQRQFGCFEFVFQDNGIGMPPEFVAHIFEPFSRAEDTRVNKIQGAGLGMAITNNLVHMMNGSINVESEPGRGSRFTVTIFLRLQEAAEDVDEEEFQGLSVLVLDDNAPASAAACDLLHEMGMDSECVVTSQDAIQKAKARSAAGDGYFAILLDWEMPEGGMALTRELRRALGKDTPILIVSAYDWSDVELDARAAGADAVISKPLFKSRFEYLFHGLLNHEDESADEVCADGQSFDGKRILLVEDNALNAEIAIDILGMTGLTVEHAENGRRAVEMFEGAAPGWYDLIFMDIQMPVMNGYEATKAIRALPRADAGTIPIVAMTANAFTEDVEAALHAGMDAHIAKPLDMGQLTKTLSHYLAP